MSLSIYTKNIGANFLSQKTKIIGHIMDPNSPEVNQVSAELA
jgi:hypothetical protein